MLKALTHLSNRVIRGHPSIEIFIFQKSHFLPTPLGTAPNTNLAAEKKKGTSVERLRVQPDEIN